jgi:hypothetical protein
MGRGWRQNQNKRRRSEERLFAIRRVNSTNAHVDVDLEKILVCDNLNSLKKAHFSLEKREKNHT